MQIIFPIFLHFGAAWLAFFSKTAEEYFCPNFHKARNSLFFKIELDTDLNSVLYLQCKKIKKIWQKISIYLFFWQFFFLPKIPFYQNFKIFFINSIFLTFFNWLQPIFKSIYKKKLVKNQFHQRKETFFMFYAQNFNCDYLSLVFWELRALWKLGQI